MMNEKKKNVKSLQSTVVELSRILTSNFLGIIPNAIWYNFAVIISWLGKFIPNSKTLIILIYLLFDVTLNKVKAMLNRLGCTQCSIMNANHLN